MQVSLITCTNNSEKTIKDCCQSISFQTYDDIEHIIQENKKKKIKIFQQKTSGIYGALNEAMKISNGSIIGILHSDDEFVNKDVVKIVAEKFIDEKIDVLFSNIYYTKKNDTHKILRKWVSNLNEGIQSNNNLDKLLNNGWMPPHTSLFFKKNLLNEIGYYDESFKISSDYDFIIRLFRKEKIKIFFLNKFTIKMRSGGISNKNIKNILIKMNEDLKIIKKLNSNPIKTILIKNLSKIKQFFQKNFI